MTEAAQDAFLAGSGVGDDVGGKDVVTSAGRSVYDNSLIMSEIYGWISNKRDLVRCLMVCKAGWPEVARIVYRHLHQDITAKLEAWCSPDRFLQISEHVRILDWRDSLGSDVGIQQNQDRGCWKVAESLPFQQFPHLEELRIISSHGQILTVGETHELESRVITIKASVPWNPTRGFTSPMIPVEDSAAATLISLKINRNSHPQDTLSSSQMAASIIQTLVQVRAAKDEDMELLASLQSLENIGRFRSVSMERLAQLIHACPSMTSLSVMLNSIEDMPVSLLKSRRFQQLHIEDGRLNWLPRFTFIPKLYMSCGIDSTAVPWMKQTVLTLAQSGHRHYMTGVRYLHLHFQYGSLRHHSYYVLSKFILGLVTADAAIEITGDISDRSWIDQIRETISVVREEQRISQMRRNSKRPPGFRLIETPRDTPLL